jgi:hypothetical protein
MGSHSDKDSAEMIEATTGKTNVIGDMIVENPLQVSR